MNYQNYKKIKLSEVATIERAQKGKRYRKGIILIQLSATSGNVVFNDEGGEIESKYAVIEPENEEESQYIYISILKSFDKWFAKHHTGMNLQLKEVEDMNICYHDNKETRDEIVNTFEMCEKITDGEKMVVEYLKELKKNALKEIFV